MDQGIQATLLEKSSSKVSPTIFEDEITNINTMWIGLTDRPKKGWQGLCAILNGHRSNNSSSDDDDDDDEVSLIIDRCRCRLDSEEIHDGIDQPVRLRHGPL